MLSLSMYRSYFFFCESWVHLKKSRFHAQGYKHMHRGKIFTDVDKYQKRLCDVRNKFLEEQNIAFDDKENPFYQNYLTTYKEMQKILQKTMLDDKSYFLIGWLNLINLYPILLEQLLTKTRHQNVNRQMIINAISMLSNHESLTNEDIDFSQLLNLYKSMPRLIKPQTVLALDNFTKNVRSTKQKQQFYFIYFRSNIKKIIKNWQNQQEIAKFMKIFQIYITMLNDQQSVIQQFQKLLLQNKPQLQSKEKQILSQAYCLLGKINLNMYQYYFKTYLNIPCINLAQLGEKLQFFVLSQVPDSKTLLYLLSQMESLGAKTQFDSRLHTMLHYLKIKNIEICPQILRSQALFCKNYPRKNINSLISSYCKEKRIYMSQCLEVSAKNILENKSTDIQKQMSQKLKQKQMFEYKFVQQPWVCTFQLQICAINQKTQKVSSIDLYFSKKQVFKSETPTRMRQIKLQILQYYGINCYDLQQNSRQDIKKQGREAALQFLYPNIKYIPNSTKLLT